MRVPHLLLGLLAIATNASCDHMQEPALARNNTDTANYNRITTLLHAGYDFADAVAEVWPGHNFTLSSTVIARGTPASVANATLEAMGSNWYLQGGPGYEVDLPAIINLAWEYGESVRTQHSLSKRDADVAAGEYAKSLLENVMDPAELSPLSLTVRDSNTGQCMNSYWRNFTNMVQRVYDKIDPKIIAIAKQWSWTTFKTVACDLPGWVNMGISLEQYFRSASQKAQCGGSTTIHALKARDGSTLQWCVGVSAYKVDGENCDTTANYGIIAANFAQLSAKVNSIDGTSWCTHFDHYGTWRMDARVALVEEMSDCGQNLWDIPCPGYKDGRS
ncbi:hypothetical protein KAFR_0B06300 [Kazachstania africana CBS 2517]|uniref:Uncharacterized protein n=1 Tax=Kazachstania africana (strain ATCC 22294 / BCRC 22015 / CBS 2517 / CECT 1963 / NBRC 1671 / NRRL Y-8276) TaxID=1071382 RepID=H2ARC6_KAZAF|nr:hypothetical protein KAFR_0B06300 [Kazachstania africana CBS 2517]CCF56926.1 hypothetical protein KAFR_0B06300 [Kazachstania africana CBS 2517]